MTTDQRRQAMLSHGYYAEAVCERLPRNMTHMISLSVEIDERTVRARPEMVSISQMVELMMTDRGITDGDKLVTLGNYLNYMMEATDPAEQLSSAMRMAGTSASELAENMRHLAEAAGSDPTPYDYAPPRAIDLGGRS